MATLAQLGIHVDPDAKATASEGFGGWPEGKHPVEIMGYEMASSKNKQGVTNIKFTLKGIGGPMANQMTDWYICVVNPDPQVASRGLQQIGNIAVACGFPEGTSIANLELDALRGKRFTFVRYVKKDGTIGTGSPEPLPANTNAPAPAPQTAPAQGAGTPWGQQPVMPSAPTGPAYAYPPYQQQ